MTTRVNLERKANRLRKNFVALNKKVSDLGTKPEALTPGEQRSLFIALRNLRRTYDDLRQVEAKLRTMP
jgi:hypothetical protein